MGRALSGRAITTAAFSALLGLAWWWGRAPGAMPTGSHSASPIVLREVARERGADFRHEPAVFDAKIANIMAHVAGLGAAVSACDADGDGWIDLYATTSAAGGHNGLFVGRSSGRYRDAAVESGLADVNRPEQGASMGSIWADVENDGDEDCLLYRYGWLELFRNGEGARFAPVAEDAGLRRWVNANAATWIDYDRDGNLDLVVGAYFPETVDLWHLEDTRIMQDSFEFATNGGRNLLFHATGDAGSGPRFEDATELLREETTRWTLGLAAADFDADGWIDLYVANDYGPEEFYRNVEGRHFGLQEDVGLSESSKSGMCVALGDFQNAGAPSVYVTNISERGHLFQGNNLRRNDLARSGDFDNLAQSLGGVIADCGWAWGAAFADLDDDGWQDLFVVNGYISGNPERDDYWYAMNKISGGVGDIFQDAGNWPALEDRSLSGYDPSRLLHNRGGRAWVDVAPAAGVSDVHDGRSVLAADLGNRGVLDVVVANQCGPLLVYENESAGGNAWIGFELIGTASNRSAVGAAVVVEFHGQRQLQVVDGGSGFSTQSDKRLHFGLGRDPGPVAAEIRWPSGLVQRLEELEPGRRHRVQEPSP